MPFVSDEQRKAAFARMKGRGGTGSRKPRTAIRLPRKPGPPKIPAGASDDLIMSIIGDWLLSGGASSNWSFLENGPGIAGNEGGPVTLTGGAIYNTPGSQWYLADPNDKPPAATGNMPGYGIHPDTDISTMQFVPAQTVWTYIYLMAQGMDPMTGNMQGGPGSLKPLGPLMSDLVHENMARQLAPTAGQNTMFVGGVAYNNNFMHPDAYSDRPWFLP